MVRRKSAIGKGRKPRAPLTKLTPEQPAARDEGPRLLPYSPKSNQDPGLGRVDYYLTLADSALGNRKKSTSSVTPPDLDAIGSSGLDQENIAPAAQDAPTPDVPPVASRGKRSVRSSRPNVSPRTPRKPPKRGF